MRNSFTATKNNDGKWIGKEEIDNKEKIPQQYNNFGWIFMSSGKK
jgi:hypothetical protein